MSFEFSSNPDFSQLKSEPALGADQDFELKSISLVTKAAERVITPINHLHDRAGLIRRSIILCAKMFEYRQLEYHQDVEQNRLNINERGTIISQNDMAQLLLNMLRLYFNSSTVEWIQIKNEIRGKNPGVATHFTNRVETGLNSLILCIKKMKQHDPNIFVGVNTDLDNRYKIDLIAVRNANSENPEVDLIQVKSSGSREDPQDILKSHRDFAWQVKEINVKGIAGKEDLISEDKLQTLRYFESVPETVSIQINDAIAESLEYLYSDSELEYKDLPIHSVFSDTEYRKQAVREMYSLLRDKAYLFELCKKNSSFEGVSDVELEKLTEKMKSISAKIYSTQEIDTDYRKLITREYHDRHFRIRSVLFANNTMTILSDGLKVA